MTLLMVQLEVGAPGLARFAHAHGLPSDDEGYLLHRLLRDAFGPIAPQPFRWFGPGRQAPGRLLGYGSHGAAALRDALALAEPLVDAALKAAAIADKPMPARFAAGTPLGFEVRACPIVRTRRGDGGDGRAGSRELDVFLHRTLGRPKEEHLSRAAVYQAWLGEKLAAGGAEIVTVHMHRVDQAPLVRRRHPNAAADRATGDRPKRLQRTEDGRRIMARRPDVTFRGSLRVTSPERFQSLLARGLGRHRAFGYGMLLLRPSGGS